MIPLSLGEIATVVEGKLHGDAGRMVTKEPFFDSRKAIPGGIFLALKGENVDGHEYVESALAAGAAVAITTELKAGSCIVVPDVLASINLM